MKRILIENERPKLSLLKVIGMPWPLRIVACTYMHTSACIHSPKMFLPVTHSTDTSKILDSASPQPLLLLHLLVLPIIHPVPVFA